MLWAPARQVQSVEFKHDSGKVERVNIEILRSNWIHFHGFRGELVYPSNKFSTRNLLLLKPLH